MKRLQSHKMNKFTPFQVLVSYYFLTVALSAGLLSLPFARKAGADWSFMDAIFTAASAVSVTGLSTISIADTFTVSGIFLLMLVLQVGGIGIMTISTFFWLIIGRKIGLKQRQLIRTDQNQINLSGLVDLLKQILFLILLIEIIGALVLGAYYLKLLPNLAGSFPSRIICIR